jgi:hypothetical protein
MRSETLGVHTGSREVVHDLTSACARFVTDEQDGLLHVFVPHATAGIAILETGAGSDDDLLAALADLLPADDRWQHRHGSHGHGRRWCRPTRRCPCSPDGWPWGPGRASAWSTSTSTTPTARCGSRSCPADRRSNTCSTPGVCSGA